MANVKARFDALQGVHYIYVDGVLMGSCDDDLYYSVIIKSLEDLQSLKMIRTLWGDKPVPNYDLKTIQKFREVIENVEAL